MNKANVAVLIVALALIVTTVAVRPAAMSPVQLKTCSDQELCGFANRISVEGC